MLVFDFKDPAIFRFFKTNPDIFNDEAFDSCLASLTELYYSQAR